MIGYAYSLDFSRVSGLECGSTYSLNATFDPTATDGQVRLMVQSVLIDRFKMRAHMSTEQGAGYALVVAKGGPKISKVKHGDVHPDNLESIDNEPTVQKPESYLAATSAQTGVIAIKGRGVSISQLADTLQRITAIPVWNRSGLAGDFDFDFRFADANSGDLGIDTPSLMTALEQYLGLKLEKQKGLVETLVIDYIEEPSAN